MTSLAAGRKKREDELLELGITCTRLESAWQTLAHHTRYSEVVAARMALAQALSTLRNKQQKLRKVIG